MGLFNKKKKEEAAIGNAAVTSPDEAAVKHNDSELLAVIAAAVSAYEAEQFVQTLYIRKLDRTSGTRPVWGKIGTIEAIDMRRL